MLASLSHTGYSTKKKTEPRVQSAILPKATAFPHRQRGFRDGRGERRAVHADVQLLRSQCWPLFLGDVWEDGQTWCSLQTQAPCSVPHFPSP